MPFDDDAENLSDGRSLDPKDRILIAALAENARESIVTLARRVGLSRSATQERLRRLEKKGIIRGYTVQLGQTDRAQAAALLAVTFAPGFRCEHVVPRLKAIPEIEACLALAGPIDLMLTVAAMTNLALEDVRAQIAEIPGIAAVSTHIVLKRHWDRATPA